MPYRYRKWVCARLPFQKGLVAVVKSRVLVGVLAASAMLFSTTGAVAAPTATPTAQPSAWAVLSVMSGGAAAFQACGAAASAAATGAQPTNGCVLPQTDVPAVAQAPEAAPVAPVAPIAPVAAGLGLNPLLLGLAALAAGIGLYFAVRNNGTSNSPA